MDEYPKVIDLAGQKITVRDADDEARWLARPEAVVAEPDAVITADVPDASPDPLDDVTIEMDNPSFQPQAKKKAKKK